MPDDDWRLMGQEIYLAGRMLRWSTWFSDRPGWDPDHCAFCTAEIDRDKHRKPHIVSLAAPVSSPIYHVPHAKIVTWSTVIGGPIVTGSVVGRVTLSAPDSPTIEFADPFVICALGLSLDAALMLKAHHDLTAEALHALADVVWR